MDNTSFIHLFVRIGLGTELLKCWIVSRFFSSWISASSRGWCLWPL